MAPAERLATTLGLCEYRERWAGRVRHYDTYRATMKHSMALLVLLGDIFAPAL